MKRLIILTDEESEFLISKSNFKYFTSMDINKIKEYFESKDYTVDIYKFSQLDLCQDYKDVCILYQTSEAPGSFYKRYIEDLVYFQEKQGAMMLPAHQLLLAHHNKIFMELWRSGFTDSSLKTVKSWCYGSWVDARNFNVTFPVVIKQASSSGGAGVFMASGKKEFDRKVKKAGQLVVANGLKSLFINYLKISAKKIVLYFASEKSKYLKYDVTPISASLIVQTFIPGLSGDYKVLYFGGKYFMMYRKNRENDFRASGSGTFLPVPEKDHEGLLTFARKLTLEVDFPIIGMDIGFDGNGYHLIEFQVIHIGTSALHRSKFWHEFHDGRWVRYEGLSNLEEEFSRSVYNHILQKTVIKQKKLSL
jgi:glutathione synthase/RimK-type ligase-like ATP-grasp enzyme